MIYAAKEGHDGARTMTTAKGSPNSSTKNFKKNKKNRKKSKKRQK
jgi:hypothetical protein